MTESAPSASTQAVTPLYTATHRFDATDGEGWQRYCAWAKIPGLIELVGLDAILCQRVIDEFDDSDLEHLVPSFEQTGVFKDLAHLRRRLAGASHFNILGLYRNPETHITTPPDPENFVFEGYDLIEDLTRISALTNCGGFPDVFLNQELNNKGLIPDFDRACEIRGELARRHPEEAHAQCELYAIWRLKE